MTQTEEVDLILDRAVGDASLRAAVNAALEAAGPSQADQAAAIRGAAAKYDADHNDGGTT